jgi:hypothetical protein
VVIAMHNRQSTGTERAVVVATAAALLLAGCASHRPAPQFTPEAPFSRTVSGPGETVCWCVKRALLSQGYMLDRPNDAGVLTGSRDEQSDPKLNVTTRLQTSCADNRNGSSIVFVTAVREESRLQKVNQSTSVGIGPATLTMPSGSAKVLGTVRRATITDPNFYNQFFSLVQNYVGKEVLAQGPRPLAGGAGTASAAITAPPASSGSTASQGAPAADKPSPAAPSARHPNQ